MSVAVVDPIDFVTLPDLASEDLGGAALVANDEFFAEKENLLKSAAAEWKEGLYTDKGKWMDGWETRRRRDASDGGAGASVPMSGGAGRPRGAGYDWCVVRLGLPGVIEGVVVDTAFFRGNYPESCSIEATEIDDPLDLAALATAAWTEILPRSPLSGDTKNKFPIDSDRRYTHVRLNIFPDGGVARLRVHGRVQPSWPRLRALGGVIDLAALEHGAWVESCSDMFFGSRANLIKPGPSRSMADGWETRRRRGPGNDWAIVRLAAPGTVERVVLDTRHFKGNAPGRAVLEGWIGATPPVAGGEPDPSWRTLVATRTQPHTRHVFDGELRRVGVVSHVRLSVYPDGGVARLRVWGRMVIEPPPGLATLNLADPGAAHDQLARCCGSRRWASAMTEQRPFADLNALLALADRTWWRLEEADWLEAFAAHPKLGERGGGAWSAGEQRGMADASTDVAAALARANQAYFEKHGFIFILCADGKSADEAFDALRARLDTPREVELRTAAEEQARITRLRLHKLMGELA
jgi:allantoicase